MNGVRRVTVAPDETEIRLDRWFRRHFPGLGHGRLEKLLRTGQVRVDGKRAKSGTRLAGGQVVRVPPLPAENPERATPQPRPRPQPTARDVAALRDSVLFMDDSVIAIDKPSGLAVQGGSGQRRHLDAMLDALRFDRGERPRLVHRLDKDTSGVLLLARSAAAARKLTAAFRGKAVQKVYWALVVGAPDADRGHIDLALAKRPASGAKGGGEKVGAEAQGKSALTLYQVVQTRKAAGQPISWLALMPLTGRTHQLRAHCAALGAPILCDGKYGGRTAFPEAVSFESAGAGKGGIPKRLMLLAREIALPHPEGETTLRVSAPLPAHMEAAWSALGFHASKGERAADDLLSYAEGLAHSPPGTRPGPRSGPGRARHSPGRR
ncbi:MAG: RluA family pseudouridine synthase [Proteobacteria bacterium]|nr:RluA family pseudouridine synthase [Pseudomonadota bacterium]